MDWDSAVQTGFTKLSSYIEGNNERGKAVFLLIQVAVPTSSQPGFGLVKEIPFLIQKLLDPESSMFSNKDFLETLSPGQRRVAGDSLASLSPFTVSLG